MCPLDGLMKVHCSNRMQHSEAPSLSEFVATVAGHSSDRESFCTDSCGLKVFRLMASLAEPQILQAFPQLLLVCCCFWYHRLIFPQGLILTKDAAKCHERLRIKHLPTCASALRSTLRCGLIIGPGVEIKARRQKCLGLTGRVDSLRRMW